MTPVPKLKRDWIGRKVRARRDLKNHVVNVPEGAVLEVTDNHGGLSLTTEQCECCGVRVFIRKVPEQAVVLLPEEES